MSALLFIALSFLFAQDNSFFSLHYIAAETKNIEAPLPQITVEATAPQNVTSTDDDAQFDKEYEKTFLELLENDPSFDDELFFADDELSTPQPAVPSSEPYRVNNGDTFYIQVYGESNSGRTVTVDYRGMIYYMLMDPLFVAGKTIEEMRAALNERISQLFRFGQVSITPMQFGGRYYTILGQVAGPGKKVLHGFTTVLSAIADAGGLTSGSFRGQTIDFSDLNHTFLARKGDYVPIDFNKLVIEGDMSQDVPLESGDYIYVPSSLNREIYVLGEVNTPTTIGYVHTISLVEALITAGGTTTISSSRIMVIRGSLVNPILYQIDIRRILRGYEPNFLLQPGDIVYVPPRRFQSLKDLYELAVSGFVSSVVGIAADKYFEEVWRDASPAHMALKARREAERAAKRQAEEASTTTDSKSMRFAPTQQEQSRLLPNGNFPVNQ
jgi:polysaccharide export outer membrane protein